MLYVILTHGVGWSIGLAFVYWILAPVPRVSYKIVFSPTNRDIDTNYKLLGNC